MPPKDSGGTGCGVDDCTAVAVTALDGFVIDNVDRSPPSDHGKGQRSDTPFLNGEPPNYAPHATHGMQIVRETLREQGISTEGTDIIMASWKPGTAKQYTPHIRRWTQFCDRRNINPLSPTVDCVINFLTESFHRRVGYESLNTARGALSSLGIVLDGCRAGNHPLVIRFMKGVFNIRPPTPRYTETWDVAPVLEKLRAMHPLHSLSLKDLTLKLVTLMALTQAARVQTLHLLMLKDISIGDNHISVMLGGNIKQCRAKYNIQRVTFVAYPNDNSLCVNNTLKHYIHKTETLRQSDTHKEGKLLLSYIKPYKPVTKDTIARWIKTVLHMSGVDTAKFTAGSVRPAAASKAKAMAVPISCILEKAGWSRETTFARYYDKHIVTGLDPFQEAILK